MINLFLSGVAILLVLSGCGWDGTPTRDNDFTPLTSIEVVADSASIAAHTSTKLKAIGNFSGLYTRDITDQAVWSSSSLAVADFDDAVSPNRVTGFSPGTAVLTATVRGVSASVTLTVSSATINTLTITPADPSIANGLTTQFALSGVFSDATIQDLTFDAGWASSAQEVATVSNAAASKGLAQSHAVGETTISATFDGMSATTLLTVTEKELKSIAVTPANPTITGLAKTATFTATGTYSDGSTADITTTVAWTSSKPAIATINSPGGVATSVAAGTTTISATLNGVSGKTDLKVTVQVLSTNGLTIDPTSATLIVGNSRQFTITATFTDSTTQDVTDSCEWSSNAVSAATVTNTGTDRGLVTGVAVGSATITATYGGQNKTAVVIIQ